MSEQVNTGAQKPQTTWGEYNQIIFAVQQAIAKLQTATLVRVEACTNDGDLSPVGFVDVLPLVNQIDGSGNPTPHAVVYGLPYLRIQGGANAVIIDPQPGDIGLAVFASRDISKVKSTKAQANPGSYRSYDFSDGIYLGGILNGVPTQFVRFGTDGITVTSETAITLNAPAITLEGGDVTIAQNLTVIGAIVGAGINLQTHVHESTATHPLPLTSEPIP